MKISATKCMLLASQGRLVLRCRGDPGTDWVSLHARVCVCVCVRALYMQVHFILFCAVLASAKSACDETIRCPHAHHHNSKPDAKAVIAFGQYTSAHACRRTATTGKSRGSWPLCADSPWPWLPMMMAPRASLPWVACGLSWEASQSEEQGEG